MLSEEVFKQIQMLHFRSRKMATDIFAGQYTSAFKGQGMEFSEVREYSPGDDPRTIDWNVSARLGHPFVKIYHEERELTVILLIDISASNLYGTRQRLKKELLAEVAGMLAFLAIRTNDKVGAILFSSQVEKFIPPKKGASHVWRMIKEIYTHKPAHKNTNIAQSLNFLNKIIKRHAIVFIISDFQDMDFQKPLSMTAKKHDLILLRIKDISEEVLPDVGYLSIKDPETGQQGVINTSNPFLRQNLEELLKAEDSKLKDFCKKTGIDMTNLYTDKPVIKPMVRLFESRGKRQ